MTAHVDIGRSAGHPPARPRDRRGAVAGAMVLLLAATAAAQAPPSRRAVPTGAQQAQAVQAVRESYAERYARAATPEQKAALAEEMLDEAAAADSPARQFALVRAAGNLAAGGGEAILAARAVDAMAAAFKFDAVQAKLAMLQRAAAGAESAEHKAQVVKAAIHAFDDAYFADRPDLMPELVELALAGAKDWRPGAAPTGPTRVFSPFAVHANAATRYMAFGRWKEAKDHSSKLLPVAYGEANTLIGGCYEAVQDWAKAEEHFREASGWDGHVESLYFYYQRTGKGEREAVRAARAQLNTMLHRLTMTRGCVLLQLDRRLKEALPLVYESFIETDAPWHGLHALLLACERGDEDKQKEMFEKLGRLRTRRAAEQPDEPPHQLLELAAIFERDVQDGGTGALDPDELAKVFCYSCMATWADVHYFTGKYLDLHGRPELAVEYWKKCMAHYVKDSLSRTLAGSELVQRGIEPEEYKELGLRMPRRDQMVVSRARELELRP